jgi:hypothetical protein
MLSELINAYKYVAYTLTPLIVPQELSSVLSLQETFHKHGNIKKLKRITK